MADFRRATRCASDSTSISTPDNVIQLYPGLRKSSRLQPARAQGGRAREGSTGPSKRQTAWLSRGLNRDGGHLPLFDRHGQKIDERTVSACVKRGWVEPSFSRPVRLNWTVCKLTHKGRELLTGTGAKVISTI